VKPETTSHACSHASKTKTDMDVPERRRGLLGELLIAIAMVLVAVWASSALMARFFLGNPHLGPVPLLPVFLTPLEFYAFPILAAVTGVALAQGSAAGRQSTNYPLGRIYDHLASEATKRFASNVPPEALALIHRVSDYLEQNQRARTRSGEARYALVQLATELRDLASHLQASRLSVSEQYAQLARSVSDLVSTRRLQVNLERESGGPMLPGEKCDLQLQFTPSPAESILQADFGGRSQLDLTLFLFGKGVILGENTLAISLPLIGESTKASTTLEWTDAQSHHLRIIVATTAEMEILQTHWTSLEMAVAPAAVV
jgi:hypothetical protein